jgi:hypothetical protein
MTGLINMAVAIAAGEGEGTHRKVFELIEPHLRFGAEAHKEPLEKYLAVTGKVRAASPTKEELRAKKTVDFELDLGDSGGEFRISMGGIRVEFKRDGEGDLVFSVFTDANRGNTVGLGVDDEDEGEIDYGRGWYYEGVVDNHVYIMEGAGAGDDKIRIRVMPAREARPEPVTEPVAHGTAEAYAEEKGFKEYEDHYYKRWDGRFEYEATDKRGRRCLVVVSAYTGKVVGFYVIKGVKKK